MWIDNLRSDVKHHGVAKAAARVGYKLANRIGHLDILRLHELISERVNPASVSADACGSYDCRFASRDDLAMMSEQFGAILPPDYVATSHGKGDQCLAIFDGSTCAAFGWYSRCPTVIRDTLVLHFDAAWVYMYHGYTSPGYRGQRLHGLGIGKAMLAFSERGIRGMISVVEEVNYRTHSSGYRLGFVDCGRIWRVGVGGRSYIGQSSSCDAYGVRVEDRFTIAAGRK
jgi:hypothetical protein